jgi:hypothetical protein
MTDGQKRYVSQQIARKTQKIMNLYHEYEEYDRTRVRPIPAYLDPQEFTPYPDLVDDEEEGDDGDDGDDHDDGGDDDGDDEVQPKKVSRAKETPQQKEARKKQEKLEMFEFIDDIIFHEDFKAGATFFEKEVEWKQEEELAAQGPGKAEAVEETDWDVQALEDEDAWERERQEREKEDDEEKRERDLKMKEKMELKDLKRKERWT